MKHLLTLLILLVLTNQSSAQKPWKWQQLNGPNTGSHAAQLLFGENGEIISVGRTGYYSSSNDGISWDFHKVIEKVHTDYNEYLYSGLLISTTGEYYFYFASTADTTDLDICGIYRSTDKGSTWSQVLHRKLIFGLFQIDKNSVIMIAQYSIFESIDKGNSWTQVAPYGGTFPIAVTNKYVFFKLEPSQAYIDEVSLENKSFSRIIEGNYNDTTGLIALNDNSLLEFWNSRIIQYDGGNQHDTLGRLNGIISLLKGNDNAIYALAQPEQNKLNIESSSDLGRSWSYVGSVLPYMPGNKYSFYCLNSGAFLYENDTALYLSRDKGSSWKEIGLPFDSVNKIIVADDGKIFTEPVDRFDRSHYVYSYFDAQLSSDRGESWYKSEPAKVRITGIGKSINGSIIAIAPDSNESRNSVWVFDSSLKTQWQKRSEVQNISSHPLIATDGSKSTYVATNGYYSEPTIYRSDDNAFSWVDINAPNTSNDIFSLDASSDGTVYFGSYSVMYRSDDRGTTWIKLHPVTDIVKLTFIKTFGTGGVLLGTEGDGLLLSNDKGNSWTRIDGNNFDTVTCIAIDSKGEVAAGTNRGLWISDSSKHNWSKVLLGHDNNLYIGGIDVAKNDDFYVGTYGATVWIGTRNYNSAKYSTSDHSSMQISPNPTNGKITITLEAANNEELHLELYDILGRRVAVLAGGKYSGENEITFNTSDLSNGIYTLILSGARNETQKIVVQH